MAYEKQDGLEGGEEGENAPAKSKGRWIESKAFPVQFRIYQRGILGEQEEANLRGVTKRKGRSSTTEAGVMGDREPSAAERKTRNKGVGAMKIQIKTRKRVNAI